MAALPIPLLLHGFLFADCGPFHYFRGVAKAMRQQGITPLMPRVPVTGSVEQRAAALRAFLAQRSESSFVLLGHSMGGLDGRFLVANHDPDQRIKLLVTVATPHRGSPVAQQLLAGRGTLSMYARRYWCDALRDLSPDTRQQQPIPDRPDVKYLSYSAVRPSAELPLLVRTLLPPIAGENDGLVPATSAVWGKHRGTIRSDHFESVGWSLALPSRQATRPFDHVAFWLRATAEALTVAANGEGKNGTSPIIGAD